MLQSYGSFAGLGLQFAGSLTAFTLAGLWLDRQLGSLPWLLLTGVAIGLLTGMWLLIKRAG
jgi:F0F1-type ATP synthase assembly protein I